MIGSVPFNVVGVVSVFGHAACAGTCLVLTGSVPLSMVGVVSVFGPAAWAGTCLVLSFFNGGADFFGGVVRSVWRASLLDLSRDLFCHVAVWVVVVIPREMVYSLIVVCLGVFTTLKGCTDCESPSGKHIMVGVLSSASELLPAIEGLAKMLPSSAIVFSVSLLEVTP